MVRRTKEDAVATRNSLLDAAEQVFYDKGVSRASLGDIAQAAGATRGAIYWHFKDKADLFNAMMDRVTLPLECAYGLGGVDVEEGASLWRLRGAVPGVCVRWRRMSGPAVYSRSPCTRSSTFRSWVQCVTAM